MGREREQLTRGGYLPSLRCNTTRRRLLAGLALPLFLLASCLPSQARPAAATVDGPGTVGTNVDDKTYRRELERFHAATIHLKDALVIAQKLHGEAKVVDVSFDGATPSTVFRVKSFSGDRLWDDAIDASSGTLFGNTIETSVHRLSAKNRRVLSHLAQVREGMLDAVLVAERNALGRAVSASVLLENGKLSFAIVVVSGDELKQVFLEPRLRGKQKR